MGAEHQPNKEEREAGHYCAGHHRLKLVGTIIFCAEPEAFHPEVDAPLCGACLQGYCVMHSRTARAWRLRHK